MDFESELVASESRMCNARTCYYGGEYDHAAQYIEFAIDRLNAARQFALLAYHNKQSERQANRVCGIKERES